MNSNIKKTYYFLKRNGIRKTYYAVRERLEEKKNAPYEYQPVSDFELSRQRKELSGLSLPLVSIVVPAYETPETYLKALLDSVLAQTYEQWELIIADASETGNVEKTIKLYDDLRITYVRIGENKGISENTNQAIRLAKGQYVALLDHDDVITPDALYEMSKVFLQKEETVAMVYSDEDKCNEDQSVYFDLHRKPDFNKDLLLTNNYMCHFSIIRKDIIKQLLFRKEYDGAQDFDLFLRVMDYAEKNKMQILHVGKVLYHWRSHELSTAANPQSKLYAYEAGKRAIADYLKSNAVKAQVVDTPHVGFYRVLYAEREKLREDIAAVVTRKNRKGKVEPTVYSNEEKPMWENLPAGYSGYMHRASLQQDVYAGHLGAMILKNEWAGIAVLEMKVELEKRKKETAGADGKWICELEEVCRKLEKEIRDEKMTIDFNSGLKGFIRHNCCYSDAMEVLYAASLKTCEQIRDEGKYILYDPYWNI